MSSFKESDESSGKEELVDEPPSHQDEDSGNDTDTSSSNPDTSASGVLDNLTYVPQVESTFNNYVSSSMTPVPPNRRYPDHVRNEPERYAAAVEVTTSDILTLQEDLNSTPPEILAWIAAIMEELNYLVESETISAST